MRRRPSVLALAGLLAASVPAETWAVELIGRTMPPYPDRLQDIGGACVSDSIDPDHVCDYSIAVLGTATSADADAEPQPRYVVAGRMAGRDGAKALWKITDAQPYPEVARGFSWQVGNCRLDKVDDGRVVAIVRQDRQQEYLAEVSWARRLDLVSGKFATLAPSRVDCVNEGYGE
ncbi:MAG: hypothetical protein EOP91_04155 [Lysobacteraceae bacterium]|nr:MAG: hypothetical protein EOP91_04155 [Xanthomonadaceae bacterium]